MADNKTQEYLGTGRRKTAVARVRLASGTGKCSINGRSLEDYFATESMRVVAVRPLEVIQSRDKYDVRVTVNGGGQSGQTGAVSHGIARALIQADPSLRPIIKNEGLLTRDPREKERKKYGQPGARKRFQYSKR